MKSMLAFVLLLAFATPAFAEEEDACAKPTKIHGFETCADIAKAEAEGEVVVYATNPEAAELRVLAEFTKLFPKIKANYTRLQAGALYSKVSAERQAKTYTVDAMQISDMGMILDFQKKQGYVRYVSPTSLSYGSPDPSVNLAAVEDLLAAVRAELPAGGKQYFGTFPHSSTPGPPSAAVGVACGTRSRRPRGVDLRLARSGRTRRRGLRRPGPHAGVIPRRSGAR